MEQAYKESNKENRMQSKLETLGTYQNIPILYNPETQFIDIAACCRVHSKNPGNYFEMQDLKEFAANLALHLNVPTEELVVWGVLSNSPCILVHRRIALKYAAWTGDMDFEQWMWDALEASKNKEITFLREEVKQLPERLSRLFNVNDGFTWETFDGPDANTCPYEDLKNAVSSFVAWYSRVFKTDQQHVYKQLYRHVAYITGYSADRLQTLYHRELNKLTGKHTAHRPSKVDVMYQKGLLRIVYRLATELTERTHTMTYIENAVGNKTLDTLETVEERKGQKIFPQHYYVKTVDKSTKTVGKHTGKKKPHLTQESKKEEIVEEDSPTKSEPVVDNDPDMVSLINDFNDKLENLTEVN